MERPLDKVFVVIPARMGGRRFPNKALANVEGAPLVLFAFDHALRWARAQHVVVATDSDEIKWELKDGCRLQATGPHRNGSLRAIEAFNSLNQSLASDCRWLVNLQLDEATLSPAAMEAMFAPGVSRMPAIRTLACSLRDGDQDDPNVVKVAVSSQGRALWFSRQPLRPVLPLPMTFRHIGVYAFHRAILDKIASLPQSPHGLAADLEQLDWLDAGLAIQVVTVDEQPVTVNVPSDLAKLKEHLRMKAAARCQEALPP